MFGKGKTGTAVASELATEVILKTWCESYGFRFTRLHHLRGYKHENRKQRIIHETIPSCVKCFGSFGLDSKRYLALQKKSGKTFDLFAADISQHERIEREGLFVV